MQHVMVAGLLFLAAGKPVALDDLETRGRSVHPCVNVTPEDVANAKARIERFEWARGQRDAILTEAGKWLEESDEYWLEFLPEPGACYAYGFTGCPICNGKTGTWAGARCSWDQPGCVTCENGHVLPDDEHPDAGTGYSAPDGRFHYLVGQFNAWVTEQWTTRALPSLSRAYLLTGDEQYAERAALLLDALASIYAESTSGSWDYPSDPPSGRLARPWYQVARTLVLYVDHYDFIHSSPSLERPSLRHGMTRRENIERHLLLDGAYYCYTHSFDGALHNGHADYLRGALAVGCLLDIPEFVRVAVEGPFSIHTMLANNIDRDGRYYESSLGYAIHARLLYLSFADPLFNLRNAEYPNGLNLCDDPRFRSSLLLPDAQVQLAGRRPNFGDSAPDVVRRDTPARPVPPTDVSFLERLYARGSDPATRAEDAAALRWLAMGDTANLRKSSRYRDWLLWHAADLPDGPEALPAVLSDRIERSWVAGMKGLALLRVGDQAALLRFGPSLNHGDPDDLGLLYYALGYELTYDLGYGLGSTHCHVGWASSTVSHCLVTVNEKNQLGGDGSGGSLEYFAALPHVHVVRATSELSYANEGVSAYQRTVALTRAGYLVDVFHVAGGVQHDYGFGSIGTELEPFGVNGLSPHDGSLAPGVAWGDKVGPDGDLVGYPGKPYWNPPPGNGYGFFRNVRRADGVSGVWGGTWTIPDDASVRLRMHVAAENCEAVLADAPGLYPNKPPASYVIARRISASAGLVSTFAAVYEPFSSSDAVPAPILESVRVLGDGALEVRRRSGEIDLFLSQDGVYETAYGVLEFDGDFAYVSGTGAQSFRAETVGCNALRLDGRSVDLGIDEFVATVVSVDPEAGRVILDSEPPEAVEGLVAVFSNPAYSRTTAYHVRESDGPRLALEASSLVLGVGRVAAVTGPKTMLSDIPHEYAKSVRRISSRFFDGKVLKGEGGGTTRTVAATPGSPIELSVEDASVFRTGERFQYLDIAPADRVRIAFLAVASLHT